MTGIVRLGLAVEIAARAVMSGAPKMQATDRPVAECASLAKRDPAAGERLGRISDADQRCSTLTGAEARKTSGLPLGLPNGVQVLSSPGSANASPTRTVRRTRPWS